MSRNNLDLKTVEPINKEPFALPQITYYKKQPLHSTLMIPPNFESLKE
jgi:hypothetical protein